MPSSSREPLAFQDPATLAQLGRLEMIARQLVEGAMVGQHRSPYKGSSVEFAEHRQYAPGDEIRHIDWRVLGKTDKYYVKEYEDETNLRSYLVLDSSGSMNYGSSTLTKFEYARFLIAALAFLLHKQRDAAGLVCLDTKIRVRLEPSTNVRIFEQITHELEQLKPQGETSLASVIEDLLPGLKSRSQIVLLSDCFDDLNDLLQAFHLLKHQRHELILFQIVTPEEEEFPFNQPTKFRSLEQSSQEQLVDPIQLRKHYLEQYHSFCNEIERFCRNHQIDYRRFKTNEPFYYALQEFLALRARK